MIVGVTIGWQKAGRIPRSRYIEVTPTKSEAVAFDQAVEVLKVGMITASAREYPDYEDTAHFVGQVTEVLRLKPWAVKYDYAEGPTPADTQDVFEAVKGEIRKSSLVGTRCECGAPYDEERGGYACAFR